MTHKILWCSIKNCPCNKQYYDSWWLLENANHHIIILFFLNDWHIVMRKKCNFHPHLMWKLPHAYILWNSVLCADIVFNWILKKMTMYSTLYAYLRATWECFFLGYLYFKNFISIWYQHFLQKMWKIYWKNNNFHLSL